MTIFTYTCPRNLICALSWCAVVASGAAAAEPASDEHLRLLQQNGIATDTDAILAYLQRLQPDAKVQEEIAALIEQLSSANFNEREAAAGKLPTFGAGARPLVAKATKSQDAEVAWRAEKILQQLDSGREEELRRSLEMASLQVLRARGESKATPVLLQTLPALDDAYLRDVACEAIWACVDRSHAELLCKSLAGDNDSVRAAAIVALEIAAGGDEVDVLLPYLSSKSALLRLAAARALADRRPQESITALFDLVSDEDDDIAWQSDALLQLITGTRMELADNKTLSQAWNRWRDEELPTAKLNHPLGDKRFDLSAGRNSLEESFARAAKSLAEGYGRFLYEADNQGEASVVDGRLLIDGDNPEGDQRLYITSERMIGRSQWPRSLEVRAKLGGKEGNNFGWHVGISVGRIKILFHPGLGGGGFRAETTDEHDYLFNNESMAFTPATDVIHEMIVNVVKTETGADFDVALSDGNGGGVHRKKFSATNEQLGPFNRIGLERSGRTGAAAMFDSISIKLGR